MSDKKPRLGRGLEALIPRTFITSGKTISSIPVTEIRPNPYQPRAFFDDEALQTLASSIKTHGLNQPIIVRKKDEYYELIAGERRYRACQMAEISTVPAIIKNVSDKESLQIALVENLEREDLNAIEEANGYRRLIEEFDLTHNKIAEIFGKSRSAVTNTLRLLNLPEEIQKAVMAGDLSEGHARTLLGYKDVKDIINSFNQIKDNKWNVRQAEDKAIKKKVKKVKKSRIKSDDQMELFTMIEQTFSQGLSTSVKMHGNEN
ncbi:ParB/RepB/Spo0J family partition protein, partial [Thermoproteota archaeon]